MRRTMKYGLLCLAVMAASLSVPGQVSAARAQRVPPMSFLEYRADTVEALALQAEQNPQVRARYARHFGIPGSRVAQFIRENLVISYLPASGRYRVYYVRPGGRIVARQVYLPRGTRVLALRNGEPVLRWICGNAMVPELPEVAVRPVRQVPQVPEVISVPSEQVVPVSRVVSVPFEQVAVREIVPPVAVAAAPVPVAPVPIPVSRAAAAVPVVAPVPAPTPVPPRPSSVVPILAAVPPITFIGGERPQPPPPITELPPPEIPVPEPGTLAMLTLAAGPMAWAAARGKRHNSRSE
ncbi:MAG TPA: PEP-CTERM sorting domain-containing protein [Armatimonadota bacterium]|nr:PEP-CTERM sorting domain-containing protein [Armatimonadota bacterium]HPO72532.1 PEP-CTERM sorting domain-containing protein [Armatimonadota bacterium]